MYLIDEQLESKWWHRLTKVLRWVLIIGVFVVLVLISLEEYERCVWGEWGNCNRNLLIELLITVALATITYFVFWLIYKKIVLYIVFGKKNR